VPADVDLSLQCSLISYGICVIQEMRLALTEMIRSSDYKPQSSTGRSDAKARAEEVLQDISHIRENKRSDQASFEDLISAFASMLQTFRAAT
jgi:hypothetical protein